MSNNKSVSVLDACNAELSGLDPDIFDYIVGVLEDETDEQTAETIEAFLLSCEFCDSEEEAAKKTASLLVRLGRVATTTAISSGTTANTTATKQDNGGPLTKQKAKSPAPATPAPPRVTTISSKAPALVSEDTSVTVDPPFSKVNTATIKVSPTEVKTTARPTKKGQKSKGRNNNKKGNNKITASEQAVAQSMEIEAELHAARVAAVKARNKLGAYKGALDAAEFTLPNPGGGQPLLEDAACTLIWGRRYGLIGRNGTGKSTMLRAFAARRVGNIPENVTVHYVSQEVNLTPAQSCKTPIDCVVEADIERTLLLEELASLESQIATESLDELGSKRHGEVLSRLDEIGSDSAHRRATKLLENLGFSTELRSRTLQQLSGGWRVRTMLAAAIFAAPDLLLLDEPTNHLSIGAVLWLARELSEGETWQSRMVVIVSHDRHFMDEVCTDCLHISGAAKRLTQCRGNYSKWAKQRKEQQVLFAKEQSQRQEEIDKLREYAG